ncbi:unnamed protein product [Sphenostylis stenocarpa]|uniref:Uncharacterized protein n=1 Tax=Sphenostylis stenocarpa TaxID=92480 RepID=A0AA86SQJ4_9FABA|nr:unnamed protein product [Sphenostylis stenocarpa]
MACIAFKDGTKHKCTNFKRQEEMQCNNLSTLDSSNQNSTPNIIHPKFSDMTGSLYFPDALKFSSFLSMSNAYDPFIPYQTLVSPNKVTVPLVFKVRGLSFKVSTSCQSHAHYVVQLQENDNGGNGFVMRCAKWDLEREVEAEMKPNETEEKGRSEMTGFRQKCGERDGVVEQLECLEREAIMGEDVGKEPTDYNRRAQIFDKSSQVFQALKEHNNDVFPQESS